MLNGTKAKERTGGGGLSEEAAQVWMQRTRGMPGS